MDRSPDADGVADNAAFVLSKAIALQKKGQLADAAAVYRELLRQNPTNADALHLLGVIEMQRRNASAAIELIDRAIELRPNDAMFLSNRGNALKYLERLGEALASFDRALAIAPDYAEALYNRGNVLRLLTRPDEALADYDRVLAIRPDYAEALNNRGNTLKDLGRLEEALASLDAALATKPDFAEAHYNRGNVLKDLTRIDEALWSFNRALTIKPDYVEALCNRGNVLTNLNRLDEALASYDRALEIKPDFTEALNNRGNTLKEMRRLDEALDSFNRALTTKPDFAEALYNRGSTLLLCGDYRNGLPGYEWRRQTRDPANNPLKIGAPKWQGEDIRGRSILVLSEGGLGDNIQFARYLPLLVHRGAEVTFLCPARLIRLLRPLSTQIKFVTSLAGQETFNFQCALMSLPLRFGTDLGSIPNQVPYLKPEVDLVDGWRRFVGEVGFKIGIAWQGNPGAKVDRGRSFPLLEFVPLTRRHGVRMISLQKNHGSDQLMKLPADTAIESLGDGFDSGPDAFIDSAAVMSNLDLIITSDTSIAHLAGALGCPTWVALQFVPDWRWLLDRNDSPWYPTMRLFRQQTPHNWSTVVRQMEVELDAALTGCRANVAVPRTQL